MATLDMFALNGRVALVTGASRGLGWAIARALAGAAIYFASEASSYCNGQVLTVDGGMVSAM